MRRYNSGLPRASRVWLKMYCPKEECESKWLLGATREPNDPNYGADADGNRGIFQSGDIDPDTLPDYCPVCGLKYTDAELDTLTEDLSEAETETDPGMCDIKADAP